MTRYILLTQIEAKICSNNYLSANRIYDDYMDNEYNKY